MAVCQKPGVPADLRGVPRRPAAIAVQEAEERQRVFALTLASVLQNVAYASTVAAARAGISREANKRHEGRGCQRGEKVEPEHCVHLNPFCPFCSLDRGETGRVGGVIGKCFVFGNRIKVLSLCGMGLKGPFPCS